MESPPPKADGQTPSVTSVDQIDSVFNDPHVVVSLSGTAGVVAALVRGGPAIATLACAFAAAAYIGGRAVVSGGGSGIIAGTLIALVIVVGALVFASREKGHHATKQKGRWP